MEDYDQHDATALAALVRDGSVTPLDLVDAAIDRIERLNPDINAVVERSYDRARQRARDMDVSAHTGPFPGVPFLLKDLKGEDQGQPSTSSTKLRADWRAPQDSELVRRYKDAGLIILGRTSTPEFGIYAVTEPATRGICRNPWHLEHTPGGSSGGSGAAVAARMVPMAHASDGGGSIRIPASHCGLFGLKPTRARHTLAPYGGEGWGGLATQHVVTRSVRDSATILEATWGNVMGDPYHAPAPPRPYTEELTRGPGPLKIAFTTRALFGDTTHDDNVDAVHAAARLARELGHHVEEACPPFHKDELVRAYLVMVGTGVAHSIAQAGKLAGKTPTFEDVEPATWLLKLVGDTMSATEYLTAKATINAAARDVAKFFDTYDVFLTPTAARPPVRVGEFALGRVDRTLIEVLRRAHPRPMIDLALKQLPKGPLSATPNTMLFNLTGQPAMSTPLFWNAQGLPIGTQWVGRFGDESTLLALAAQLESAKPWADRRPALS